MCPRFLQRLWNPKSLSFPPTIPDWTCASSVVHLAVLVAPRGPLAPPHPPPRPPLAPRAPHFVPPALHRPPAVRAQGAHDAEVRLRRRDLERRVLLHDARADRVPEAHRGPRVLRVRGRDLRP